MIDRPRWMARANCRGVSGDVFFPELVGIGERLAFEEAREYCAACEVRQDCLEQAMKDEEVAVKRFGMFGGMTPRERRGLQSERDAQAARELQRTRVRPAR